MSLVMLNRRALTSVLTVAASLGWRPRTASGQPPTTRGLPPPSLRAVDASSLEERLIHLLDEARVPLGERGEADALIAELERAGGSQIDLAEGIGAFEVVGSCMFAHVRHHHSS